MVQIVLQLHTCIPAQAHISHVTRGRDGGDIYNSSHRQIYSSGTMSETNLFTNGAFEQLPVSRPAQGA